MLDLKPWRLEIEELQVEASPEATCCVLEQGTLYSSMGSTQEDPSRHDRKIVDWDVKNKNKQLHAFLCSLMSINLELCSTIYCPASQE